MNNIEYMKLNKNNEIINEYERALMNSDTFAC
jgi:hypothetical protein